MLAVRGFAGERELIARGLLRIGANFALSRLPARDSLLVLTYHRIGNPEEDAWDPRIFSATGDELYEQISFFKRTYSTVTLEEALAYLDGTIKERTSHLRILLTFDDGYLDNYKTAFPILKSQGVQGVFFLCTSMVGSNHIPWWDHIAHLLRTAHESRFTLRYPVPLEVDVNKHGLRESLRMLSDLYKGKESFDSEQFIQELTRATGGRELPPTPRRFLDWEEARYMIDGGMAVGAHTHSHRMLSKLDRDEQRAELVEPLRIFSEQLGITPDVLAYPFGGSSAFSEQTQELVRTAGYRAAFSSSARIANRNTSTSRYDIKRVSVGYQSWTRMQVQAGICRITGKFWP